MIVLNLYGGPGVGKSTTAAMLFAHYKRRGIRVELAREQAKDFVYQGRDLERNQVLLMALQYQLLKDLQASGTELVISDSPLRQQLAFARSLSFYDQLAALNWELCGQFKEVNVLLKRAVPFHTHGREHTEEQSIEIDRSLELHRYNMELDSPVPETVIRLVDARVLPLLEPK